MAFLTDRKRAVGLGSAKSGAHHHWQMIVTSVALLVLVPLFVLTFGHALGLPYDEAVAYYSRPFPAVVGGLTMAVGFFHLAKGAQVLIEDYVHGLARSLTIIAVLCVCYAAAAFGLWAIVRLAL